MLRTIFYVFGLYAKSFFSPKLYKQVAHEKSGAGLDYLFAITFAWCALVTIVITALSWFFFAAAASFLFIYANMFLISPVEHNTGFMGVIILTGWYFINLIISLILIAVVAAVIAFFVFLAAHITLLFSKPINFLLQAKLDNKSLIRLASYSYWPSLVVFYLIISGTIFAGAALNLGILMKMQGAVMYYVTLIPNVGMMIVLSIILFVMIPLPVWVCYIAYAILCSKFFLPKKGFVMRLDGSRREILKQKKN